jgi:hypothetical protein
MGYENDRLSPRLGSHDVFFVLGVPAAHQHTSGQGRSRGALHRVVVHGQPAWRVGILRLFGMVYRTGDAMMDAADFVASGLSLTFMTYATLSYVARRKTVEPETFERTFVLTSDEAHAVERDGKVGRVLSRTFFLIARERDRLLQRKPKKSKARKKT